MTGRTRCPICTLFHRAGYERCDSALGRTWPLDALLAAMARPEPNPEGSPIVNGYTARAARLEVDPVQLHRYSECGVPDVVADRWCTRLNLHPVQVFGWAWIEAGLTVVDRQRLEGGWRQAWLHGEQTETTDAADAA